MKTKFGIKIQTAAYIVAMLAAVCSTGVFINNEFAHAKELRDTTEQLNSDIKLVEINGLATSLEIRIDILEERIIRARKDGDTDSVLRMKNTLKKLLQKYHQVTKKQLDS